MRARFPGWGLLLLFGAVLTLEAAERDIVRTFSVAPGATIAVDTYRGSITVTEADTQEVRVAVRVEIGADREPDVEKLLRTLQLDFAAGADHVHVTARRPQHSRATWVWDEDNPVEPTFRLTVPRRSHLRLATVTGRILVGHIEGSVNARVEAGDVFIKRVDGDATVRVETGDVVVAHGEGDVTARVLRGTLRLGTVSGRCDLRNASGDIEVMAVKSDLFAQADAGAAIVGFPRDFSGRADVRAAIGGVVAKLDPAANADVHASASWLARVESRLASTVLAGRSGTRRLSLRLNRGGASIVLRGSGGNVLIERGDNWIE